MLARSLALVAFAACFVAPGAMAKVALAVSLAQSTMGIWPVEPCRIIRRCPPGFSLAWQQVLAGNWHRMGSVRLRPCFDPFLFRQHDATKAD